MVDRIGDLFRGICLQFHFFLCSVSRYLGGNTHLNPVRDAGFLYLNLGSRLLRLFKGRRVQGFGDQKRFKLVSWLPCSFDLKSLSGVRKDHFCIKNISPVRRTKVHFLYEACKKALRSSECQQIAFIRET